jgi:molybdopterin-containing oxidoreductase family iron-sulfur binding subunit
MTLAGLGAVATGVGAVLPGLIDGDEDAIPVRGTHGEPESIGQAGGGESARRIRQWMMIIDLRRCDGCQSQGTPPQCTEACNDGHFIPEPMEWIEVYEHELSDEAKFSLEGREPDLPIDGTRFIPTPCQQCQNAPCVNVCPVGATWSTPEGVVLIDQERCIGCRMCMAACPYERRFFTWSDPPIHPDSIFVEPSPEHQVPLKKGVVAKCDFCPEMARAGRLPFCAQACPQNAIYYGDLEEDLATNGVEVVRASTFMAEHSATHYKEELGTRPRVFYIPGHGELAGRDATDRGRLPVRWLTPDEEGAKTWQRSKG